METVVIYFSSKYEKISITDAMFFGHIPNYNNLFENIVNSGIFIFVQDN